MISDNQNQPNPPNNGPDDQPDALTDLLWDYLHGELSAEQAQAFADRLRHDPDAARRCAELAELLVMTRDLFMNEGAVRREMTLEPDPSESAAAIALAELARQEEIAGEPAILQLDPPFSPYAELPQQTDKNTRFPLVIAAGLAAVIALAAVVTLLVSQPSTSTSTPPTAQQPPQQPAPDAAPTAVATLTNTHHATWAPGPGPTPGPAASAARANPPTPGTPLHPGTKLTLTAGFAEITTNDGAVVILEAPATIALTTNDNAIELLSGKLVGICETPSSKGFVVHTPHMNVTDLGTRFGVESAADATSAHVLQGTVRAELVKANGPRGGGETLSAGEAAQASHAGDRLVRIKADPARFAAAMPDRFLPEGTGFGLAIGDVDPNWRVVAINGSPVTEEAPLRVTDKPEPAEGRPEQYEQSPFHWLVLPESLSKQSTTLSRTYTVRCRFDWPRAHAPARTDLILGFQGGRAIEAVRVNGHSLRLPEAMTDRGTFYNPFEQQAIDRYLVEGANTIEIDLYDTDANTTFRAAFELRPSTLEP